MDVQASSLIDELKTASASRSTSSSEKILGILQLLLHDHLDFATSDFLNLLHLVLASNLSQPHRRFVVRNLLNPRDPIPIKVLYLILGCIGKPTSTASGESTPLWSLQQDLLRWLVCWNHAFVVYGRYLKGLNLQKASSILYQLLPYEFLRSYIVNLIILLNSTPRKWQIQLTGDLFSRFPSDQDLKFLLILFKLRDPWIDFEDICGFPINIGSVSSGLEYPSDKVSKSMTLNKLILQENLKFYDTFNAQILKRTKLTSSYVSEVLAPPLHSFDDIIQNLNVKHFMDLQTFCASRYTTLYGLLNSDHVLRLDTYVRLQILDLQYTQISKFSIQLNQIMSYGIQLNLVQDFILFKYKPHKMSDELILKFRALLFRYVTRSNLKELLETLTSYLKYHPEAVESVLFEISTYIPYWGHIDEIMPAFYNLFTVPGTNNFQRGIQQALFLRIIRKSGVLVTTLPPSWLVYSMLLSNSPVVQDEIFGFICYCKENAGIDDKELLDNYIEDLVNWIWNDDDNDTGDNSIASILHLDEAFISLVIANKLLLKDVIPIRTGNLFYNPAWTGITNQLVQDMEDAQAVSDRHSGPLSSESVKKMEDKDWLKKTYEELKLEVLLCLDEMGYKGIADFLFMAVDSIQDKRQQ